MHILLVYVTMRKIEISSIFISILSLDAISVYIVMAIGNLWNYPFRTLHTLMIYIYIHCAIVPYGGDIGRRKIGCETRGWRSCENQGGRLLHETGIIYIH